MSFSRTKRGTTRWLLWGLVLLGSGAVARGGYSNPNSTVFLSSYTGPQNTDLEVNYVDVSYDSAASQFHFTATMNGAIGTTPGALYVFGLNRGMGTARFTTGTPSIGQNIVFDSVLIITASGGGQFNDFISSSNSTAITSGIHISGSTITADLSASLFPSMGFALNQYTYNLWPRVGTGSNTQISQFVPSDRNLLVSSAVPEPASLILLGLGGISVLGLRRRR